MATYASKLLTKALSVCRDAEISEEAFTEINLANPEHQKFKSGIGLRVNIDGRLGYAWSEGEMSESELLETAAKAALSGPRGTFSQKGIFTGLQAEAAGTADGNLVRSLAKMQRIIQNLDFMLPSLLPERKLNLSAKIFQHTLKLTVRAGERSASRTLHALTLSSHEGIPVSEAFYASAPPRSASDMLCRLVWRSAYSKEIAWPESSVMSGVFTAAACGRLLEDFAADVLSRPDSPQLRETFPLNSAVSITDDGTLPSGFGTVPFDGEGMAKRAVELVKNGRFRLPLYDLSYAKLSGLPPSCLSVRPWGKPPKPGYANLVLKPGKLSLGQLCERIDFGILLDNLTPLPKHMKREGEFARRCETAFILQHGRPVCRTPQFIVRARYADILGSGLLGLGYGREWNGRALAAPLAAENLIFEETDIDPLETGSIYPELWW
ncbi:hypothetical protein IJT93_12155 [bacterium]|nr:hypothetical protein [bacterium]